MSFIDSFNAIEGQQKVFFCYNPPCQYRDIFIYNLLSLFCFFSPVVIIKVKWLLFIRNSFCFITLPSSIILSQISKREKTFLYFDELFL